MVLSQYSFQIDIVEREAGVLIVLYYGSTIFNFKMEEKIEKLNFFKFMFWSIYHPNKNGCQI